MNVTAFKIACAASCIAQLALAANTSQPPAGTPQSTSKVVLLGTGTPAATPDRSGPATAIVVNDTAYLIDFGPGVVRRASGAAASRGIAALQPTRLRLAFATHLHSDHTVGYADLIFTPWTLGRRMPLEVYGPRGLKAMTDHLIEYHYNSLSMEELQADMMKHYSGQFVVGRDLDVY